MEVELSKKQNLQVKTIYEVVEPEKYEGEEIWKFNGLNEQGIPYFKADAQKLGLNCPDKLQDLSDAIEEFVNDFDGLVEITVATKDEYQNVYVNGLDGDSEEEDEEEEEEEEEDEDEEETNKKKKDKKKDKKIDKKKDKKKKK